jgi:hypothetical protein
VSDGFSPQSVKALIAAPDDRLFIAGRYEQNGTSWDVHALFLDKDGTTLVSDVSGGPAAETVSGATLLADGNYLIGVNGEGRGRRSVGYLMRYDPNGELLGVSTFDGKVEKKDKSIFNINDIVATPDGGALMTGFTRRAKKGESLRYVAKLDAELNVVWEHRYTADQVKIGLGTIHLLEDGRFLVVGSAKVDGRNVPGMQVFTAEGEPGRASIVPERAKNRLVAAGSVFVSGRGMAIQMREVSSGWSTIPPMRVVMIGPDGSQLWRTELPDQVVSYAMDPLGDDRLMVLGSVREEDGDSNDAYLAILGNDGSIIEEIRFGSPGVYENVSASTIRSDGSVVLGGNVEKGFRVLTLDRARGE